MATFAAVRFMAVNLLMAVSFIAQATLITFTSHEQIYLHTPPNISNPDNRLDPRFISYPAVATISLLFDDQTDLCDLKNAFCGFSTIRAMSFSVGNFFEVFSNDDFGQPYGNGQNDIGFLFNALGQYTGTYSGGNFTSGSGDHMHLFQTIGDPFFGNPGCCQLYVSYSQAGLSGFPIALDAVPGTLVWTATVGNTIPEPASLALLGLGLAVLGVSRRKQA